MWAQRANELLDERDRFVQAAAVAHDGATIIRVTARDGSVIAGDAPYIVHLATRITRHRGAGLAMDVPLADGFRVDGDRTDADLGGGRGLARPLEPRFGAGDHSIRPLHSAVRAVALADRFASLTLGVADLALEPLVLGERVVALRDQLLVPSTAAARAASASASASRAAAAAFRASADSARCALGAAGPCSRRRRPSRRAGRARRTGA